MFFLQSIDLFLTCGLPLVLLATGFLIGTLVERSHLRRLERAERALLTIPLTDVKTVPPGIEPGTSRLVAGSVVIATDHFRTFAATLRMLIGGEVRFYERLMQRARREAICRMMHQAHRLDSAAVVNLRIEASNLAGMERRASPRLEVIAYGTAILSRQLS